MRIETVRGTVDVEELGPFLAHEHLLVDMYAKTFDSNARLEDPSLVLDEVEAFRQAGGSVIVEVTPDNVGRDPQGLRTISEATEVHIVMGCGYYWEPFYPAHVWTSSVSDLARRFISEIETGVNGSGIRPGVIGEVGSNKDYVSPAEERVLRAAARAQRETGLTITTHSPFERIGLSHIELFREEGVPMESLVIGHMDHRPFDLEYQLEVARSGAYFEYDMIGRTDLFADQARLEVLLAMLDCGYANQILLSSDIFRRSHLKKFGGHGYAHVLESFVPALREAGVDEQTLERLLVRNPREAFAIKPR